ncbi:YggN family protein [Aestuariibacter sp. AA17]|uniref:YggN family protein n=1 Tax=Fluctibacter corallii TaxID=2984329 RepID=A0ABT3A7N0_9ALTE|nr:YggN family protein [Aestuariibacter sp. AA17]MCV2884691.1 YggN family protein [Aestuariibacter sp. AA17]
MLIRKTLPIFIAAALVGAASNANAMSIKGDFSSSCNVELDGNLKISNQILTVSTDRNNTIEIDKHYTVKVNGEAQSLSADQQRWVENYYDGFQTLVPEIASIAADGISIASEAIDTAFSEILGQDSEFITDLTGKMNELGDRVQSNFYAADGSIQLDSNAFQDGDFIDAAWDEEFDQAVDDAISSSMGHLMMALGKQLIVNGADIDAFTAKMERFAEDIERDVEAKAERLEARADALCYTLQRIDDAENSLQQSSNALSALNVVNVVQSEDAM